MPPWVLAVEWAFVIMTIAYALRRGDRTVRWAAAIYALTELGVVAAETLSPNGKTLYLYVDIVGLAAMIALTLRAPRSWLAWACAFRLVILGTHVGYAMDPRIDNPAYLYALNTWLMLAYVALLWGAVQGLRRRTAERGAASEAAA